MLAVPALAKPEAEKTLHAAPEVPRTQTGRPLHTEPAPEMNGRPSLKNARATRPVLGPTSPRRHCPAA